MALDYSAQNATGPNSCWPSASDPRTGDAHCKAEIDAMLARESEESKSDQSRLISPVAR